MKYPLGGICMVIKINSIVVVELFFCSFRHAHAHALSLDKFVSLITQVILEYNFGNTILIHN